jgi:deoxyribonuclease-4
MVGGVMHALEYAISTECEAFQIFSKNPRQWNAKALDPAIVEEFRSAHAACGVGPFSCHASYLINAGAEDEVLWARSILALGDELKRAGQLGASGVVLHLGRRFHESDDEACLSRVADCAERARELAGDEAAVLLLENSAGAGRQFGSTAGEMVAALLAVRARGVEAGLCIDTCHSFAAGHDLREPGAWRTLFDVLTPAVGPDAVALVHANDCKGELGGHKDRHEWIGDGYLGDHAFAAMFTVPELDKASAVVEMPGDPPEKDLVNVRRLKTLRGVAEEFGDRGPTPA